MFRTRWFWTLVLALLVAPSISGDDPIAAPELKLGPLAPPADYVLIRDFLDARLGDLGDAANHRLTRVILDEARRTEIEPRLILALIHVESSGDRHAVSSAGALGLMQLRPPTAEAVADELGIAWTGPETLFDPELNVRMGVHYLARLVDRFGDLDVALAAYNWGPTRIARVLRRGRMVPDRYIRSVHFASRAVI